MSEDVYHRSPDLSYHELRLMELIAPHMDVSEDAAPEHVEQLQTLEAAEVIRRMREVGLAVGPIIGGQSKVEEADRIQECHSPYCDLPARAEWCGRFYCGHCFGIVSRVN